MFVRERRVLIVVPTRLGVAANFIKLHVVKRIVRVAIMTGEHKRKWSVLGDIVEFFFRKLIEKAGKAIAVTVAHKLYSSGVKELGFELSEFLDE